MSTNADSPARAALREAKQALRSRVLAARDALPADARERASAAIRERIAAMPSFVAAGTLLLTLPFGSEWDTRPLARAILAGGRRLVLPRVDRTARMLALHLVADLDADLVPAWRGIPEPHPACPAIAPAAIDFVLVPGVAFDAHGRRLGYGGGFYDRLLPMLTAAAPRIAGAFDEQVVDVVPAAGYDQRVACIVTPTRTLAAPA